VDPIWHSLGTVNLTLQLDPSVHFAYWNQTQYIICFLHSHALRSLDSQHWTALNGLL